MFQTKMLRLIALGLAVLFSTSAVAGEPSKFIRVKKNKKGVPVSLETGVVTYEKKEGDKTVKVDLVGAVHIADHNYYAQLNEDFENYDVVLYELVAEKDNVPQKGVEREQNILGMIQKMTGEFLGLEHQVSTEPGEGIDYEAKNFVHCDVTPDQLAESMAKNGDNNMTVMLSTLLENMRKQNKAAYDASKSGKQPEQSELAQENMLQLLKDPEGPTKAKRIMAEQFDKMTGDELGAAATQYILTERNEAAMKIFNAELAERSKKDNDLEVAVFYGAAHMQDFEKRLEAEGFKKTETKWNLAWDLRRSTPNPYSDIFNLFEGFGE